MVRDAGTHPCTLGYVYDVETAVTLSVSCLLQMEALALGDAIDAFLVCVAHGVAPVESRDPQAESLLLSRDHALNYFDAESFDISAMASCTVVMNCAGKMMVEFFSTEISAIVWRVRS
jgi:hypothetical protein